MIREYRKDDLEDVVSAWSAASALAHPFLSDEFMAVERRNIADVYLPNAETWVWETDGRVVGFIALLGNEVGGLFVDPQFHGAGIGRALVDHARRLHGDLEVDVFKDNTIGRAFYASYGFVLLHEKVHEGTGLGVLRLRVKSDGSA